MNGNNANCIDASAIIASTARILGKVIVEQDAVIHDFVTIYENVSVGTNAEIFEGAVVGKPPTAAKALARRFSPELKSTRIGKDSIISPHCVIYADVQI